MESFLALDEALARALQEEEDEFRSNEVGVVRALQEEEDGIAAKTLSRSLEDPNGSSPTWSYFGNSDSTTTNTSVASDEDDLESPNNMTYEELQTMGEGIGDADVADKGLSDELISRLKKTTYKKSFFSRKEKKEKDECVICCMSYKNRQELIILPCNHSYHLKCISKWLKMNKVCPVCKQEVSSS